MNPTLTSATGLILAFDLGEFKTVLREQVATLLRVGDSSYRFAPT